MNSYSVELQSLTGGRLVDYASTNALPGSNRDIERRRRESDASIVNVKTVVPIHFLCFSIIFILYIIYIDNVTCSSLRAMP